jgi:hypothetical protein
MPLGLTTCERAHENMPCLGASVVRTLPDAFYLSLGSGTLSQQPVSLLACRVKVSTQDCHVTCQLLPLFTELGHLVLAQRNNTCQSQIVARSLTSQRLQPGRGLFTRKQQHSVKCTNSCWPDPINWRVPGLQLTLSYDSCCSKLRHMPPSSAALPCNVANAQQHRWLWQQYVSTLNASLQCLLSTCFYICA